MLIELAVIEVSRAGDERQVGEAVECWLWPSAGNRPGAEDLFEHRRIGRLLDGVDLNLVNNEADVNGGIFDVDDDQVTRMEILEVSKDLRYSKWIVDVSGNRG
ncbi:MAG TPA: hypothetical protein VF313_07675, partial [Anaerolineaceae bacterium]